jgi:hypothetical protein
MDEGLGDPMSGALKIAGAIVGVIAIVASGPLGAGIGLAITSTLGMSAATLTLISTGLAIGSSLLAPKAKAPSTSPAATDRLFAGINLRAFRHLVFGHTAMATEVRDQEYSDNQTVLHRFLVIASHKVQAVEQLWFDDKLAWTAAGGAQGEFAGYLNVTPVLEGSAANAINISSRMGASRRFTGLAYLYLRYKLTGNSKNTDSPFAQSIPTRVTVIGKAALVYDPRLDSSRGGSGGQRAEDQTTWAWNDDAARNPALQLLWYLLGWRIRNPVTGEWKLAVGKGIPPERIDIDSFITAANLCDEQVARAAGGTEPRYRSDGIFTEGDDPSTVLDNFKAAMNADLDDVDGKLRITVLHNDLGSPQIGLTADDVLDSFRWTQTPSLTDSFNVIRGSYTDPSTTSLYQQVDYPEVRIDSPDGIDRVQTVNLPMVQSPSQAQRLVKQRLQRMQYGGMFEAVFQATAWRYRKGDVVPFTFPALGWANKLFRVVAMTVQVDGTVPMTLREEHPDIYLWDASDAPAVQGAVPTTYNQNLLPVVLDLANIGSQAVDAAIAAGQALDRIDALSDDGVLTGDEKAKVLLKEDAELAAEWNLLDTQAAGLSSFAEVASARVTASSAWTAWITYRNALSPAWNNTTLDTFVDRTVFRGKLTDLRYALNLLAQALRKTAAIDGFNRLRNTRFENGLSGGWTVGSSPGVTVDAGYPSVFLLSGSGVPFLKYSGVAAAQEAVGSRYYVFYQDIPVQGGERLALQVGIEGQGSVYNQYLLAQYIDSAGNGLPQQDGVQTVFGAQPFNTKLRGFVTTPANAAKLRFLTVVNAPVSGGAFTGLIVEPMVSTARPDQTDFPPYSPGVADGADGAPGVPGAPGANGQTLYTWVAFADSPDGYVNFTNGAPGNRGYQGLAVNKTSATESTNADDYQWGPYRGPANFGLVGHAKVTIGPDYIVRTAPWSDSWDASGYSSEAFIGGAFTSSTLTANSGGTMFGLNTDPATDAGYSSIDYAFYTENTYGGSGLLFIYESAGAIATGRAWAPDDVLTIAYNNRTVTYYHNGTVVRQIGAPAGLRLYFDSSLAEGGSRISGIKFGPVGSAGADGEPGPPGSPGGKGDPGQNGAPAVYLKVTKKAIGLDSYANGGVKSFANANGQLTVMSGSDDVTAGAILSVSAQGCAGTINTSFGNPVAGQPKGYYQVTGMSEDTATLTLSASYGGQTMIEFFSLVKQKGGYEIVGALPGDNLFEGRVVYLSTDKKLYRFDGSGWNRSADGADIAPNSITTNAIAAGAVTAAQMSVTELSAITARIGLLRTSTTGLRTEISDNGQATYNASNVLVYQNGIY